MVQREIDSPPARASSEEIALLRKWQPQIDSFFYKFPSIGSQIEPTYLCDDFLSPARVARKDSALCLIISGLTSASVYDSYSHSARERAQTVLQSILLPAMKIIGTFRDTTVGFIGASIYYGISGGDTAADTPEMLLMVSPMDECRKFVSETITEDEFLDRSDIFLADVDSPSDVRKVKLALP